MSADEDPDSADSFLAAVARIDDEPPPGSVLAGTRIGRFTVRGHLGRGGMGVVYRAEDEQLGREVALKMLRAGAGADPARRARFLREARSAASLVHPNVAAVYEIGETASGELFIAMELIAGEDLRRVLARGPLAVSEATRIALGIARGVAAAHQRGIVHRDLKPENVMLDAAGEPKVLDFGLAKLAESGAPASMLTEEGVRVGTPGYMSPEQASGEPVDTRSDVFSFGVVLFELLAGRRPLVGDARLRTVRAEVPRELEDLVDACLQRQPARRPETMRAVADALANLRPARAASPSRWVAAAMLLVGLGIVVSFGLRGHAPSAAPSRTSATFTRYPPPTTANPAAAAAYAAAMQHLRDASIGPAQNDLERAVKLDPAFAAAHLRLSFPWFRGTLVVTAREHFAAASQLRASLDPRDSLLLAASEAAIHSPVDWSEVATRLREVLARYPDDVEALTSLAWVEVYASHPDDARQAARRALAIDPELALAHSLLASTFLFASAEEAQREVDQCLALSKTATTCLRQRSDLDRYQGKCADFEATARRLVAVEPNGVWAYFYLADALAVRGAPLETTRTLLDRVQALLGPDFPIRDITLTLLVGDFPAAIAAAQQVDRLLAEETTESAHVPAAMIQIASLDEEGLPAEAVASAESFERRAHAWDTDDWRVRHYLLYARHHAGQLGDAAFAQAFRALESEVTEQRTRRSVPSFELVLRTSYLRPADLPAALPFLDQPSFLPEVEALRGHALLVAGRAADAVVPLRTAAAQCNILPRDDNHLEEELGWGGSQTFTFMHAHLWLGQALEATSDTAGACAAYGAVLERWRDARPRSVTVEAAKSRSLALHCP